MMILFLKVELSINEDVLITRTSFFRQNEEYASVFCYDKKETVPRCK